MKVLIKRWGNSAAVRIPDSVMVTAHLNLDPSVEIKQDQGGIVIERNGSGVFSQEDLLSRITSAHSLRPVDPLRAVGGEIW